MSEDQLQPADTLDDHGVDDVLDEGFSPPESLRGSRANGTTAFEVANGETLDQRLAQEEPEEPGPADDDRAGASTEEASMHTMDGPDA